MRAISLHQPWASAIALGAKRVETRTWRTKHRGRIAIHAAKNTAGIRQLEQAALEHGGWPDGWLGALEPITSDEDPEMLRHRLPFGFVVATARIVDCIPTEEAITRLGIDDLRRTADYGYTWCERDMGDYRRGRWAWELVDVRTFETPIPETGRQGLFNLSRQAETRALTWPTEEARR